MIEELVKEKRIERDRKEEEKIFSAIHKQAYYRRLDDENKQMLKNMAKQDKKKNTDKLTEIIVCSVLMIIPMALWLWALLNAAV